MKLAKIRKPLIITITVLAALLAIFAMNRLNYFRTNPASRTHVIGYGFVMIFGCITFVRGLFTIRRLK